MFFSLSQPVSQLCISNINTLSVDNLRKYLDIFKNLSTYSLGHNCVHNCKHSTGVKSYTNFDKFLKKLFHRNIIKLFIYADIFDIDMVFAGQSVYRMYPLKPLNPLYLVPAIVSAFALPVMLVKMISVGQHFQFPVLKSHNQ